MYFPLDSEDNGELLDVYLDLDQRDFARKDYKELLKLCIIYLGGSRSSLKFSKPGAINHSRWMGKLIATFKIVILLRKIQSLPPKESFLIEGQLQKLERFLKFDLFIYIPWWFTAPLPQNAPQNDITLILKSRTFPDHKCGNAVIKAASRHLWYLTEELVPLSLFSSNVDDSTKSKLAAKLTNVEKKVSS